MAFEHLNPSERPELVRLEGQFDVESQLHEHLNTEFINEKGTPLIFYVVSYDPTKDPIFGEDTTRTAERKFEIMAKFEFPNEDRLWSAFLVEGMDQFHMFVTKMHFKHKSQLDDSGELTLEEYKPQEGDILKSKYNDYWYEIQTVKDQDEQFHQRQHTWDLIVAPMKDHSYDASEDLVGDEVETIIDNVDVLDIGDHIESEADEVLYEPQEGEEDEDPFSDFNQGIY